jgi:transposase
VIGVDVVYARCAGIDIGKADMKVCVRVPGANGRRHGEVRTFSTMAAGVLEAYDWLESLEVTLVAMEATGSYWKPVYYALEHRFETWLLNARHMRNLPGRKTDVADAAWIAQLLEHGLVRPSFVPPEPIRHLRDLTRYRAELTGERTREAVRLEQLLEDSGVKVSVVASRIMTKSVRAMLEALIAGERDPDLLADLAKGPMRRKIPALREALVGYFNDHHAFLAQVMLDRIDAVTAQIAAVATQIESELAKLRNPTEQLGPVERLCTIPGVSTLLAQIIIAEVGLDMTRFPTAGHLASWAGMCPGNNESAGRHGSGRTRHGDVHLRAALGQAAITAVRAKNTYLSARYRRLIGHIGRRRALVAIGHKILIAVWHILGDNVGYQELGADYFDRRISDDRKARRAVNELHRLGFQVTIAPRSA